MTTSSERDVKPTLPTWCPDWCDGASHGHELWRAKDDPSTHLWYGGKLVGSKLPERTAGLHLCVNVEERSRLLPMVHLDARSRTKPWASLADFQLTSGEARSLAAMLVQAADLIDLRR